MKRSVGKDRDRSEDVAHGLLRCQRERKPADAKTSQKRCDVVFKVIHHGKDRDRHHNDLEALYEQRRQLLIKFRLCLPRHLVQMIGNDIDQVEQEQENYERECEREEEMKDPCDIEDPHLIRKMQRSDGSVDSTDQDQVAER